jgi:hypothetical protein
VGDADLSAPGGVSEAARPLTAAELLDAIALERAELPALATVDQEPDGDERARRSA